MTTTSDLTLTQPLLSTSFTQKNQVIGTGSYGSMNHRVLEVNPNLKCPRCRFLFDRSKTVTEIRKNSKFFLVHAECTNSQERQNEQFKVEFRTVLEVSGSDHNRIKQEIQSIEDVRLNVRKNIRSYEDRQLYFTTQNSEFHKAKTEQVQRIRNSVQCVALSLSIVMITYIATTVIFEQT